MKNLTRENLVIKWEQRRSLNLKKKYFFLLNKLSSFLIRNFKFKPQEKTLSFYETPIEADLFQNIKFIIKLICYINRKEQITVRMLKISYSIFYINNQIIFENESRKIFIIEKYSLHTINLYLSYQGNIFTYMI